MSQSSVAPLHPYTAEMVIVVTRTVKAGSTKEVEDYMVSMARQHPDLTSGSDVDVTVVSTECEDPCPLCDASKARLAAIRVANIKEYLELEAIKLADPFQLSRMKTEAGREVEIKTIARGALFAPFADFTKRVKRHANIVRHEFGCTGADVEWTIDSKGVVNANGGILGQPYQPLSHSETATLYNLIAAADVASQHEWLTRSTAPTQARITLEVVGHRGRCVNCGASHLEHGLLVTIPWAGRVLSREYLL